MITLEQVFLQHNVSKVDIRVIKEQQDGSLLDEFCCEATFENGVFSCDDRSVSLDMEIRHVGVQEHDDEAFVVVWR